MNDALRQTGRTTRLIEKAVHQASCGFAVYVVVGQSQMIRRLQEQVQEIWDRLWPGRGPHGIKVETLQGLGSFDFREMRTRGAHPNSVFLVEHTLAEARIESLQRQMAALAEEVRRLYPLTV